jgi:Domain of unknown function (DUF4917)
MAFTGRLRTWSAADDGSWKSLLVGNGASIAVCHRFAYSSLLDEAHVSRSDRRLFSTLGTSNFESALRGLHLAEIVCRQEGHDHRDVRRRYRVVRRALVRGVNSVHVGWSSVGVAIRRQMRNEMLRFRTVYSTNYDLLVYRAVMTDRAADFRDFFWGPGHSFDPTDVDVPAGVTKVLYLHGALHLYRVGENGTAKLTAGSSDLLSRISGSTAAVPLFVSEGRSEDKKAAIARSDYLSFGNDEFESDSRPLVVFGHSLGEQDDDLLPAIDQPFRRVAVSVMPGKEREVILRKAELKERVPRARLSFFDATSHPLGAASMRAAD